jgi:hypothetical protein
MNPMNPKISGFTFLRNAVELAFPFEQSIRSLLPLVDEFLIAVGRGTDDTLERIEAIGDPKIRIIETVWNERMSNKGFVYAQQKMIAQYSCTGDWAFYLEGDEVLHEAELDNIRQAIARHHPNPAVEALVFDYYHFFGSPDVIGTGPGWYRRECRLIRNTIRTYAPDGQYWLVTENSKRGRNPQAALANAHVYHYGWIRPQAKMQEKLNQVSKYWSHEAPKVRYSQADAQMLSPFCGQHPAIMKDWLAKEAEQTFQIDPAYQLTARDRRLRLKRWIERLSGRDLSRKHFKLIA